MRRQSGNIKIEAHTSAAFSRSLTLSQRHTLSHAFAHAHTLVQSRQQREEGEEELEQVQLHPRNNSNKQRYVENTIGKSEKCKNKLIKSGKRKIKQTQLGCKKIAEELRGHREALLRAEESGKRGMKGRVIYRKDCCGSEERELWEIRIGSFVRDKKKIVEESE